jgi:hypothetical protein
MKEEEEEKKNANMENTSLSTNKDKNNNFCGNNDCEKSSRNTKILSPIRAFNLLSFPLTTISVIETMKFIESETVLLGRFEHQNIDESDHWTRIANIRN